MNEEIESVAEDAGIRCPAICCRQLVLTALVSAGSFDWG
jgi:hypothetical protein